MPTGFAAPEIEGNVMTVNLEAAERERRRATGQRLRQWRIKRERSQAEIARTAGITQASLSNYETGKRELPLSTALSVAAALDISLGDVLEVPDIIVLRDSRLGKVVKTLVDRPDLLDSISPRRIEAEAAS
jgi:transcriptional regulator with XRE-family HTH domain